MKKRSNFIALAVLTATVSLFSCESKKQPTMTPQSTELSGDLKDYFEVVDKEITAGDDSWSLWNIELKRTDKPFPWEEDVTMANFNDFYSDGRAYCKVGFGLETFDKDGNLVGKRAATACGLLGPYSSQDVLDLMKLQPGETGFIRWDGMDEIEAKGKKFTFKITSAIEMVGAKPSNASASNNWDKVLDSYEAYVNKYVACMKKAMSGDTKALSEYLSLLEKAEELGEQLENASSSMTAKQVSRYTKINAKMLEAAASGF